MCTGFPAAAPYNVPGYLYVPSSSIHCAGQTATAARCHIRRTPVPSPAAGLRRRWRQSSIRILPGTPPPLCFPGCPARSLPQVSSSQSQLCTSRATVTVQGLPPVTPGRLHRWPLREAGCASCFRVLVQSPAYGTRKILPVSINVPSSGCRAFGRATCACDAPRRWIQHRTRTVSSAVHRQETPAAFSTCQAGRPGEEERGRRGSCSSACNPCQHSLRGTGSDLGPCSQVETPAMPNASHTRVEGRSRLAVWKVEGLWFPNDGIGFMKAEAGGSTSSATWIAKCG